MNFSENAEDSPESTGRSPQICSCFEGSGRGCTANTLQAHQHLTQTESLLVVTARLACKYLRNSSLRVIYGYFIHERRVDFIELYFKGGKEREDGAKINRYLREHRDDG